VADDLANSAPRVWDRTKDFLVEKELTARTELVIQYLQKLEDLDALLACSPDVVTFDIDGNEHAAWSKSKKEQRDKWKEQVNEIREALQPALSKSNYDKLKSLK